MALLLGIAGIYGVISYSVSQRTREIGIRMALGAQRGEVTRMFVRYGLGLAAIGIACGLAAAIALTRLMAIAAVRGQPDRSADLRRRVREPRVGRGPGELRAGASRHSRQSSDRPSRGVALRSLIIVVYVFSRFASR